MKKSFYITLDVGGTRIKMGILKNDELIDTKLFPAHSEKGFRASLDIFQKEINDMLAKHNARNNLGGIGMAFAGLVNVKTKKIISTNEKHHDAASIDIDKWVSDNWNTQFFLDNDARMAAVGEWKYGAGRGSDDIVMATLGTGIGTSAVIEGKLLRGKHFQAGCLGGHFTVQVNGNLCNCGNVGCAEAHSSTWSIVNRVKKDRLYKKSFLYSLKNIDFAGIFKGVDKHDVLAKNIIQECLDVWAADIVNLIHAYDPEIVVLGGGVLKSKDKIIPHITEKVHKHAWTPWGEVQIKTSELKNNAALFGLNYCLQNKI